MLLVAQLSVAFGHLAKVVLVAAPFQVGPGRVVPVPVARAHSEVEHWRVAAPQAAFALVDATRARPRPSPHTT